MDFGFLSNIAFAPNTKTERVYNRKERNPITADLRVFKDGSVYPSQTLVDRYNLEYTADGSGNGFDVIDSRKMTNTASITPAFLMIAAVKKGAPKVDLFAKVKMEDGKPGVSVMEQGAKTFGQELLQMVKEVYGVEPNEQGFVDLNIVTNDVLAQGLQQATNGIYFIPKVVARGEKKGQPDYERRENLVISILAPATSPVSTSENTEATSIEHNEDADAQLANSYAEQAEAASQDTYFPDSI